MTDPKATTEDWNALQREAQDWVIRLGSGEATAADARALQRWRQTSREHRRAFAEANLLWGRMGTAAAESASRIHEKTIAPNSSRTSIIRFQLGRRAVLGGGLAAAAAASAYVVIRPPFDLWPSLTEIRADYRTETGQQRRIALKDDISVKLNTRSSLARLPPAIGMADCVELLSGEAAITTALSRTDAFAVLAGQGRTIAQNARFNIRIDPSAVCVTCLDGEIEVEHLTRRINLKPHHQISYSGAGMTDVADVDDHVVSAWERGQLIFRGEPVSRVIEEVNRYRSGRIILMDRELGRRPVLATFRLDRIDEVVPRLQAVFDLKARNLPGGIVLLG